MQKQYFKNSRIKLKELFDDTFNFLKNTYRNSNKIFTESSPFGQILYALLNNIHKVLFYVERSTQQLNIYTADRPSSIQGLSALTGHQHSTGSPSTGILGISYNGNSINSTYLRLPNKFLIRNVETDFKYTAFLSNDYLDIQTGGKSGEYVQFRVYQGEIHSSIFTGTGTSLQTFHLNLKDGDWVDISKIFVYVNGVLYENVPSLYDMSYNSNTVSIRSGVVSGIDICFGTGILGNAPEFGSEIFVEYLLHDGTHANMDKSNRVNWLIESECFDSNGDIVNINEFVDIAMYSPIENGRMPENLELTKQLTPMVSRSLVLAQTSNYETFFKKMQMFRIIKCWTQYDRFNPFVDNIVFCLLVPDLEKRVTDSQNYFTLPIEQFRITDYEKYQITKRIEESGQKIWGTYLHFVDPVLKNFAINIRVNYFSGSDINMIRNDIENKVSDYLLKLNRIDYLPKSDLIALLETVPNIDFVNVDFISEDIEKFWNFIFTKQIWYLKKREYQESANNTIGLSLELDEYELLYDFVLRDLDDFTNENIIPQIEKVRLNEIYQKVSSLPTVNKWLSEKMDSDGNIIFQRETLPIFRGNFYDRFSNFYNSTISQKRLSPINIYFTPVSSGIENFKSQRSELRRK